MRAIVEQPDGLDEAELVRALRVANVPTLLAVLYQLTGDRSWLGPRYRTSRAKGLDDNPTGGLPPQVQEELRLAVAQATLRWSKGEPVARPAPRGPELMELLSACMGEEIPAEYEPMTAEELGVTPAPAPKPRRDAASSGMSAIVIGAGISGLVLSRNLTTAGIPHVIFEKNDRVGGTWVNNPYPGCGVDTPSYLYSFSFYQREWSQHFAKRAELETYISDMAEDLNLIGNVRFGMDVVGATWDDREGTWAVTVHTADGTVEEHRAPVLVSAVGQLSKPKLPNITGMETFRGDIFHSARWPEGLSLRGKRVAIVGTGASAMQIVPAIVDDVSDLVVYQRSPQWVAPSDYYFDPIPDGVHYLMRHVPFYYEWYRVRLGWIFNDRVHPSLQLDPDWELRPRSINRVNEGHRRYFERYLRAELDGRPDLVEKSLPDYPPFGKRMLLDNGWFRALRRDHVELVTEAVAEVTEDEVVTSSGARRPADVVVVATGFEAQRPTYPLVITGRDGVTLREAWSDDDGRAYLGVATPGFPNLFVLYGPNSSLGHGGSFIFLAERAANYVADLLCGMVDAEVQAVDIREHEWERYARAVDEAHSRMIWTQPGFTTWYTNSRGRVVANMPWRVVDYWKLTREASLDPYLTRDRHSNRPKG